MALRPPLVLGSDGVAQQLQANDALAPGPAPINSQAGTAYTLALSDDGGMVVLTNASAVTLTVPASLPAGFNCVIVQGGAGQVQVVAGSGASLANAHGLSHLYGQNAVASILVVGNVGGSAAQAILSGDCA